MGWGGFFDKIMDKLPIQGRVERWKNEIDKLESEKKEIVKGTPDAKKVSRLIDINNRLDDLNRMCKNKAQD